MGLFGKTLGTIGSIGGMALGATGVGSPLGMALLAAGSSLANSLGEEDEKKNVRADLDKAIKEQEVARENAKATSASRNRSAWSKAKTMADTGNVKAAQGLFNQSITASNQSRDRAVSSANAGIAQLSAEKGKYAEGDWLKHAGKAVAEGAASYALANVGLDENKKNITEGFPNPPKTSGQVTMSAPSIKPGNPTTVKHPNLNIPKEKPLGDFVSGNKDIGHSFNFKNPKFSNERTKNLYNGMPKSLKKHFGTVYKEANTHTTNGLEADFSRVFQYDDNLFGYRRSF
jgi:hypothetical protein